MGTLIVPGLHSDVGVLTLLTEGMGDGTPHWQIKVEPLPMVKKPLVHVHVVDAV
jgi:hypothetical protein